MTRKAMVMAAGRGTRLRPITDTIPKPLVSVAGIPLVDRALDWLAASGVEEAVVNTHYLAGKLAAHLAPRRRPRIHLSHEEEILETGGGIKNALPLLGEEAFFVVNGDVICLDGKEPALHRLESRWRGDLDALLLVHPVEKAVGYHEPGDFFIEGDRITGRRDASGKAPYVFTGIQLLHPRIFKDSPDGAFSLNVLYNHAMQSKNGPPRVAVVVHDGDWLHVGDAAGLAAAEAFLSRRS